MWELGSPFKTEGGYGVCISSTRAIIIRITGPYSWHVAHENIPANAEPDPKIPEEYQIAIAVAQVTARAMVNK